MDFERFWAVGIKTLRDCVDGCSEEEKYFVKRWCVHTEDTGQMFPLVEANPREIKCLSINASRSISIPKSDMKKLYEIWDDYIDGKVSRMQIIEKVPRPTYCVSLMKYLRDKVSFE
ncbi:MAG: hypothetical protein JSU85_14225 [Candidatus Zixiibacteriota bacterium]|nr:MAG: hypothetical protein JSU85_14225 [candidate division Zixibacteria bacterium]